MENARDLQKRRGECSRGGEMGVDAERRERRRDHVVLSALALPSLRPTTITHRRSSSGRSLLIFQHRAMALFSLSRRGRSDDRAPSPPRHPTPLLAPAQAAGACAHNTHVRSSTARSKSFNTAFAAYSSSYDPPRRLPRLGPVVRPVRRTRRPWAHRCQLVVKLRPACSEGDARARCSPAR
jgi:hypothetical protein